VGDISGLTFPEELIGFVGVIVGAGLIFPEELIGFIGDISGLTGLLAGISVDFFFPEGSVGLGFIEIPCS
jgi:hypothetical protein